MANIVNTMNVSGLVSQYGIYTFVGTTTAGNYYHFKTNCTLNTFIMTKIEALGNNYRRGNNIRCAWTWYTYTYLTNETSQSIYAGLTAQNPYMSSDGYVCFKAYTDYPGDISFTFNVTQANPTGTAAVSITAASQNSTSGNYY
jgi:hypothetical protein